MKAKYGVDLAKSVEKMAHHRLTKSVNEDMVDSDGYRNFASDSLPLDLYELKITEETKKDASA